MIMHVPQLEQYGCAIACCAMIRGVSYEEAAETFGPPGRGLTHDVWGEYLARHGFAVQHLYRYDQIANGPRSPWPLSPWAPAHICAVDAGHGIGSHLIVLLADGAVLDPATDAPRCLSDYGRISFMAGIFRVGAHPFIRGATLDIAGAA
ncbi:MAG: hypothetical protein AB1431_08905 [Pseudomonadota bacterium]